jgi:PAS domain S-box-containing protein
MRKDSTGLRVELAIGFLVALLIGVGWLGLSRMGDINASTNRLFDERWDKLYVSRLASSYFNSNYRIITRYFLLQDGDLGASAALTEQIKENTSNASARWKQILAGPVSPVEKDMLLKILAAKAPADKSLQEAWSLLADGRKSGEANKLMVSETLPLLNRYRDTWVAFMDYEQDQMNQAKSQIKTSYADVWRISSILVSLAIALAVCIAFFVARKFSAEMQERERAQDSIRHLNESLEKKVAERTEELARTVDTLREEVNERRVQEANLRRLAAIVESTDDAIIGATLDGVITDWNAGAERMFGFSRSEIIGKPILTIVPPELSYEPPESREKILKGESVVRYESVRIRKDGKPLHIAIAVSPLKDQSGRVVGRCAVLRDNTERKFIEDAHRRSEASFRSFVENAPYGILRKTLEGRIVQANPALVEMLGYASEKEVLGLNMGRDV